VEPKRDESQPLSRGEILQRKWWLLLLVAALIGAATFVVSGLVPATYESSSKVRVGVLGGGASQQSIAAANDLASQLAQVVGADTVVSAAGKSTGESTSTLRTVVTGGTVADQNVIQIKAGGSSPDQAQRRTAAVSTAFIDYVRRVGVSQSSMFNVAARRQLKPLTDQINEVTKELEGLSPSSERYETVSDTLSTLISQRSAAVADIAQNSVGGRPAVTLLESASAGAKVQPKPALYGMVGFLVGLLIVAQLIVYLAPRRS